MFMAKKEYILKKFVKANSIAEAIGLDSETPVEEVYLAADKPDDLKPAIGFHTIYPEE